MRELEAIRLVTGRAATRFNSKADPVVGVASRATRTTIGVAAKVIAHAQGLGPRV